MTTQTSLDRSGFAGLPPIPTHVAGSAATENVMEQRNQQIPPPWPEDNEAALIAASRTKRPQLENRIASPERPFGGSGLARLLRGCVAIAAHTGSVIYAFFKRRF
jgi:hypothetical protein